MHAYSCVSSKNDRKTLNSSSSTGGISMKPSASGIEMRTARKLSSTAMQRVYKTTYGLLCPFPNLTSTFSTFLSTKAMT
jgi:hypothetical protein